jgi:putative transposase
VTERLHRGYGAGYLHFITTSCYERRPFLGSPENRDLFLQALERVRRQYGFVVLGYVVMPEHVHLLVSEPRRGSIATIMQAIKQSSARKLLRVLRGGSGTREVSSGSAASDHIWQRRFYDFVVFTERKRVEKLRYIHRNPVPR